MLQDLKDYAAQIKQDAAFMSLTTLAIYDGLFEFGEDEKGVVAHFSAELEKAARLMHSHKKQEQAEGIARTKVIARALSLLVHNVDPWAAIHEEK